MYENHVIGVIVPAYNEEALIEDVIQTIPPFVDRIYVVDDASTDNTWKKVLAAAREDAERTPHEPRRTMSAISDGGSSQLLERGEVHPPVGRIVPIRHLENRGAGGAIKTGYLAARRDEIDIAVTMDGDGQMDPEHLPDLLDPIVRGVADYAKGNRLLFKEYREEMPRFRFVGNAILTFLTKIASGYWKTMDPQNGYTAISRHALENVGIEKMYEYYGYCNDLLVRLNANGMRVADVAIPANYGDEESSITYHAYIRNISGMLLRDFLWRLKVKYLVLDFHPLALFYLFGALTAWIGIFGGLWSLYRKVVAGNELFLGGSVSFMLFAVGVTLIMFAMLFDMQVNEDWEVQIHD